jgi:hypothetical protein
MPTVKLQNGKVLLKDGKVSCTCCAVEPDCCMYPADELGFIFEATELPATLYGKWAGRADGTFTKSGSTFTNGTVTIRVNSGGTAWEFYDSEDDATSTIGNCLIRGDGGLTPENDIVEDQFADCYKANFPGYGTLTLYRVSLCIWATENYITGPNGDSDMAAVLAYSNTGFGDIEPPAFVLTLYTEFIADCPPDGETLFFGGNPEDVGCTFLYWVAPTETDARRGTPEGLYEWGATVNPCS